MPADTASSDFSAKHLSADNESCRADPNQDQARKDHLGHLILTPNRAFNRQDTPRNGTHDAGQLQKRWHKHDRNHGPAKHGHHHVGGPPDSADGLFCFTEYG